MLTPFPLTLSTVLFEYFDRGDGEPGRTIFLSDFFGLQRGDAIHDIGHLGSEDVQCCFR